MPAAPLLALLLALLAALLPEGAVAADVVRVDRGGSEGTSRLTVGVTHTQHSLDPWGDPAAVARGRQALREVATLQNQHLYGWGTLNPEPEPGVFDWSSLDRRMALIRETGGDPVLTLCCAPDWMTALRTPTSTYPNLPPLPEHEGAFARLAARVVRRYPDVRHVLVWNELKGLWGDGTWDVARYTRLYNRVYDAVKAVDPRIRVGGPYLNVEGSGTAVPGDLAWHRALPITPRNGAVLDHWLAHAHGADFVAIDRGVVDAHDDRRYPTATAFGLTRWFGDVVRQVRRRTALPVWYAEDYVEDSADPRQVAAMLAAMLVHEVRSGVAATLRWSPQQRDDLGPVEGNAQALFTDTRRPGGGRPLPAHRVYRLVREHLRPGTPLVRTTTSSPSVVALGTPRATLLVNARPRVVVVQLEGVRRRLAPYAVRLVPVRGTRGTGRPADA